MHLPFKAFTPDFDLLLKVLRREKTERPVLFEFIINLELCREVAGLAKLPEPGSLSHFRMVIEDLKLDGKHSFEDGIYPVEEAWDWWSDRIAIMGGIDMDFLARKRPEEIHQRSLRLLEKTFETGGFALGSGNSIPEFIPRENYLAMLQAAADYAS